MNKEIVKLVKSLGWDYDRFSSSGKETYDKIINLIIKQQKQERENVTRSNVPS
jgi:hypothetical protein